MMTADALQDAHAAFDQIRGLRMLAANGMKTKRTEQHVLNSLNDEALAVLAAMLITRADELEPNLKGHPIEAAR